MVINIKLDTGAIASAISELEQAADNLRTGTETLVDILTTEGANIAQQSYGGMATAGGFANGDTGIITASGEAVVIAEFGAGDDTMPVMFENYPGVDVYPGAYSEQVGSGEYAATGQWHFGNRVYKGVPARAGLLNAKFHIQANAAQVAQEVIHL